MIVEEGVPAAMRDGVWSGETALRTRDGRESPVSQVILAHKTPDGTIAYFSTIARDLRGQKRLEEQLRQAAKMEAVGRLAGGIAHDFNNLLTVISGYSDLLMRRQDLDAAARKQVGEIHRASHRAAGLTSQLLAFGRQQVIRPKVLDLNGLVAGFGDMLRRLIGEDIRLVMALAKDPLLVKADPGQLGQILMNLAVNARDAMPNGGTLAIETSLAPSEVVSSLGRSEAALPSVRLVVRDTGSGMDADTKVHIFDPFFTTKGLGKGTGLGLSIVYGIVQEIGGTITVDSAPGQGATFTIDWPQASGAVVTDGKPDRTVGTVSGTETILLVEGEGAVRTFVHDLLVECGYDVMAAAGGEEALRLAKAHPGSIHLLLTDLIMPGMNGRRLAEQIVAMRMDTKVLLMSGYTDDTVIRQGVQNMGVAFIQKPFTAETLQRHVRAVLDTPRT
ncbi:MAG: ATP-binding protein [Nitrospiraceae bacterium]